MKSSLKQEKGEERHYRWNKKYVWQGIYSPGGLGSIESAKIQESLWVPTSSVKQSFFLDCFTHCLTLEDGTDRLFQNVHN